MTMFFSVSGRSGGLLDNRAHLGTVAGAGSSDEDPYSVAGSGSSGSSGNGNSRNRWERRGGGEVTSSQADITCLGPAPETVLHSCHPATTASTAAKAASGAQEQTARPGPRPATRRRRRRPGTILTTLDYQQGFLILWKAERRNRRREIGPILDRYWARFNYQKSSVRQYFSSLIPLTVQHPTHSHPIPIPSGGTTECTKTTQVRLRARIRVRVARYLCNLNG